MSSLLLTQPTSLFPSSTTQLETLSERFRLGDRNYTARNHTTAITKAEGEEEGEAMAVEQLNPSVAQLAHAATQQAAQQQAAAAVVVAQQQQAAQQHQQQGQAQQKQQQQQQIPSTTQSSVQPLSPLVNGVVANLSNNSTADTERCQWEGCTERFGTAEELYEHICGIHIGRKSTNNLQLVCRWPTCSITTVKRDHITSHVRVHVSFKPHRCPVCGKAFKRPQDLKKHHKTHADESSGGQNGHSHGPNGNAGSNGTNGTNGYGAMNGGGGSFYGGAGMHTNGGMQFPYNPQSGGGYYHQPAANLPQSYGHVYYNVDNGAGAQVSYRRDDDLHTLNNLFGTIKQPNFNAASYPQFSSALTSTHGVILPPPINTHGMDYGSAIDTSYPSHLPQLTNVRSKADLLLLQDRLEKMMQAIDAHDRSQAMAAQVSYDMGHSSLSVTSEQTPDLTPGTSVMSYSPGHSPIVDHTPISATGIPSYPHLHNLGLSAVPSLGSQYDHGGVLLRHHGGRLQRAPPVSVQEPVADDRSLKGKKSGNPNIDPALASSISASSGSPSHSEASSTPRPESRRASGAQEQTTVSRDSRIVTDLLIYVKVLIENEQFEEGISGSPIIKESGSPATSIKDEMDVDSKEELYPSLPS